MRDLHQIAGVVDGPNSSTRRATVTRKRLTTEIIGSASDQTILLALRVTALPPVAVLDMVWSPAIAPRCAGGHPALAILVDAEGELNHSLAVRPQVHWERPVVLTGEKVLSGRFDDDPPLLHAAWVVDVRIIRREGTTAREDCIRVPMTGPGVAY